MAVAEPPPTEPGKQTPGSEREELDRDRAGTDEPEVGLLDRTVSVFLFLSLFGLALITLIGVVARLWQD